MKLSIKMIAILATLLVLTNCNKKPYTTYTIKSEIIQIAQKKICILAFSVDPDIAIQGGSVLTHVIRDAGKNKDWESNLSEKLVAVHLDAFVSEFRKSYSLVGIIDYSAIKNSIDTRDSAVIRYAVKNVGADLGIIVRDHFGWQWNPADAGIGVYNADLDFYIVNQHGIVIWSFASRINVMPKPSLNVKDIASAITATTPTDEEIVEKYAEFFQVFPQVITHLIKEDTTGQTHKGCLTDYINMEDYKSRIILFNK